jgi:outer membrane protein OmpA-like peptidoglycan-associated protein
MGGRRETAGTSLNGGRRVDGASPQGVTESNMLKYTNSLRQDLQSRNLYTPNRIYPITEKTDAQNVINAVGSIISLLTPFKSYDLKNTWYGRLVTYSTPLSEIGLAMLGNQLMLNFGSHTAQQAYPSFNLANWFDGNKETKVFTKNINYNITKKKSRTSFQDFLNSSVSYTPARNNPFNTNPPPLNTDYVQNSGPAQLSFLFRSFNQNIYKEGFTTSYNDTVLTQYSVIAGKPLTKRNTITDAGMSNYRNYFTFFTNNPYSNILPSPNSIFDANTAARTAINISPSTQEYAPSSDFVENNFGVGNTKFRTKNGYPISEAANNWVAEGDEFKENATLQVVWGRDGISSAADEKINYLRGTNNLAEEQVTPVDKFDDRFNIHSGLLEYTRNLLNASEGQLVDMTRKAFVNKNKYVVGFNGSALWVANDSKYSGDNAGVTGVRQHSALDQYNRFAKTIRYNGNTVYNGNENSVIFDRVLPRIHPTMPVDPNGVPNNKNLMFSLENLAVRVISKDGVGIIDDEYGSSIPISEVGQFNGRLMWFPPYDITINETTTSKYDEINMVGRNEPMFSYMNSMRTANLTFTLLVDYPQNLKNLQYQGTDKHRIISEFFAFGGDAYKPEPILINPELTTVKKQAEIENITGPTNTAQPDKLSPPMLKMYFPNDFPSGINYLNIVDLMYLQQKYEIAPGCESGVQGEKSVSGLNDKIYFVTGTTGEQSKNNLQLNTSLLPNNFSQYDQTAGDSELDKQLKEVFQNVNNRQYYDITIVGAASQLHESAYNKALGLRRAEAAKFYIENRIKTHFKEFPDKLGININISSIGESTAPASTAPKESINSQDSRRARYASIQIERNKISPVDKVQPISLNDQENVKLLTKDKTAIDKVYKKQTSNNVSQTVMNERKTDQAIQKGFQSIEGNYYNPVFHTQTPEDFHRRLTFLQQCMRQGTAKRYNVVDESGILRAKNSVFGRQPICVLRIGDFFFTKVIITSLNVDYAESTWDMNPEGFGMQPMMAKVTLQLNVLGGQSLKGPIDALQNAVSFNYYANSSFSKEGMYSRPSQEADKQEAYINGILTTESKHLNTQFDLNAVASDYLKTIGINDEFNSENR